MEKLESTGDSGGGGETSATQSDAARQAGVKPPGTNGQSEES